MFDRPNSWFPPLDPRPAASVRLYLFPPAGAGASVYAGWRRLLPATIEPCPVQLPGRHERAGEPPATSLTGLLEDLQDELESHSDGRPFALFGHSLGGLLAYRLTLELEKSGAEPPVLLGVSGWSPALTPADADLIAELSDEDFAAEVGRSGAVPPGVLADPAMRSLVLGTLRADLSLSAQFTDDGRSVSTPCVVYGADDDRLAPPAALAQWPAYSTELLAVRQSPGEHFSLFAEPQPVLTDLTDRLTALL